jgi:hypothetical protein
MLMDYVFMGAFVIAGTLFIRTVSINQTNSSHTKSINTVKLVLKFLIREFRSVFILYTSSIGIYIVIERMLKYRIYPATEKGVYSTLKIIHHMEPNMFVSRLFFFMLTAYIVLLLPHNLLKLYSKIINENNYKDHLHIACNKVFLMVRELPKKVIESYDKRQRDYKNKRR